LFSRDWSSDVCSTDLGHILRHLSLLGTPVEHRMPDLQRRRNELLKDAPPLPREALKLLARDLQAMLTHIAGNLPRPPEARGHPDPHRLTAERKVMAARSLHEALRWVGP